MSPFASLVASVDPRPDTRLPERARLSQIDASLRWPVVLFVVSGAGWLMLGTVLGLVAAVKLVWPDFPGIFFNNLEVLTYGRIVPAGLNALVYGWGNNAVFAVGLWIMARLCGTKVKDLGMLYVAGGVWNTGVLWGVGSILVGVGTPVEWLEMPAGVAPVLAASYALIAVWAILCFRYRQEGPVYVSQWYLLGAFLWFPWVYLMGELMVAWAPARGTVQALAGWWYAQNAFGLWFTPAALAAIYYCLPKVLGRPIRHYYLSALGFVALAMFTPWTGARHLIYGPVPVWIQTVSIAASMALMLPVVVTALNFHTTAWAGARDVWRSPTLRFIVFGALSYTVASTVGAVTALRSVSVTTEFTQFMTGYGAHGFYAFFTMAMFGAIYFMMPRVLEREWPSAILIHAHFWATGLGIGMVLVALYLGGWSQGVAMNDASVPFLALVKAMLPMNVLAIVGGLLVLLGQAAFMLNLLALAGVAAAMELLSLLAKASGVALGEEGA